ncbi:MAG: PIN domain-containing protein [Planctomycetota bacterium]
MAAGLLIDTSIFLHNEHGRLDLLDVLSVEPETDYFISTVTAAELLHGTFRGLPTYRIRRSGFVHEVLSAFDVIDFDMRSALACAEAEAAIAIKRGHVGARDIMIAGTALSYGLAVVTSDAKSFPHVDRLDVRLHRTTD